MPPIVGDDGMRGEVVLATLGEGGTDGVGVPNIIHWARRSLAAVVNLGADLDGVTWLGGSLGSTESCCCSELGADLDGVTWLGGWVLCEALH
jgi:hypothetical protein